MADEANEELDSTNQSTEEVVNTDEVEESVADTESEDLEALQEKNKRLFERAKKAEAEAKLLKAERMKAEEKAKLPEKQGETVTFKDQIALVNAKVHEDDLERVLKFAKDDGISVAEALKSEELKAILNVRAEQRKSAEVANTSGSKRTTAKVTDEQLVNKGYDHDDPEAVAEARFNLKKKN